MAPGCTLGASYCAEDGYITPPRNVAAYTAALVGSGVAIAERTRFGGLSAGASGTVVQTSRGAVSAGVVVLAGGPQLAAVGALAGISIPAGGVRHHVAVTEEHPAFASTPMAFDVPSGIYWRPEEGGLLFGMSDPDEPPGENRVLDFDYLALMRVASWPRWCRSRPGSACAGRGRRRSTSPPITCRSSAPRPGSTGWSWRRRAGPG